jgi:hypothetical protein
MRRLLLLTALAMAALVSSGTTAPVNGPEWFRKRVEKASGDGKQVEASTLVFQRRFKAGERASIVAVGDHQPVVPVGIQIRDKDGVVVAQDLGTGEKTGDFAGVVWYPPRDGEYTIVILNFGKEYNDISVAVK